MRKLGILLIVLCVSSVSFGIGSFNAWVAAADTDPANSPFADDEILTLWVQANIPNITLPVDPTYVVTRMGNTFVVNIHLNNTAGPGDNVTWDLGLPPGVGPLAGPLTPGVYIVVVKVYGTYYSPFWPGFSMPNMLFGMASGRFVVNGNVAPPQWPWWHWWHWCW